MQKRAIDNKWAQLVLQGSDSVGNKNFWPAAPENNMWVGQMFSLQNNKNSKKSTNAKSFLKEAAENLY